MTDDPMNIEKMISDMNRHVPAARRSLQDYMESSDLTYRTRSGEVCEIERSEIDYLAETCTDIEKLRLRLPIFVTTDISGEEGAWKVDGTIESKVIAKILGKKQFREDSVRLYYPDLKELRKILPSAAILLYLP
jgi:uncharacterized protein